MKTYTYTVLFEHDADGSVIASIPALPGCISSGSTYDEALANVKEAIQGYLASLRKDGHAIPEEPGEEVIGRVQVSLRPA
jgi:predicted RNase H-like HicB family nuclease